MDNESLEYLAQRLEAVAKGEFVQAAALVRRVIASTSPGLQQPDAENALYHAVWGHISDALDHQDYDIKDEQAVYALESEMAGRTLNHRLARGWMVRSENGPTSFKNIDEFL